MKTKKISQRKQIKILKDEIFLKDGMIRSLNENFTKQIEQLRLNPDKQMMEARIKLSSNLGQLVEAVCKAIYVVVSKEVM